MIELTKTIAIREDEVQFVFVRASGPGGQNVNKVATAVQLRFDVAGSSLPGEVKGRLLRLEKARVSKEGALLIEARRFREQERNREDALRRLGEAVARAAERPKPRRKTRPTGASRERRLEAKRKRSAAKGGRRAPGEE